MKKLFKSILVAIPALTIAAALGLSALGCDDTSMTMEPDLSAAKMPDMAKKD